MARLRAKASEPPPSLHKALSCRHGIDVLLRARSSERRPAKETTLKTIIGLLLAATLCGTAGGDDDVGVSGNPAAGPPVAAEGWIDAARGLASEMAWSFSDIYFHRADYAGTFYSLLGVIAADPRDPDAYICAGVTLLSMDMAEESLKLRLIGLEHTRDLFDMWHDLGFWYLDRQDFARARDYFEEAAKRPCPPFVVKMWAHACEHDGDLAKALDIWETVREITPDDPVIDLNVHRIKKLQAENSAESGD